MAAPAMAATTAVAYRSIQVDGLKIAYREGGNPKNPKLVLLHGFPAGSHQYRNLIQSLAGQFHVIAPDYPGFGESDIPDPAKSVSDGWSSRDLLAAGQVRGVDVAQLGRQCAAYDACASAPSARAATNQPLPAAARPANHADGTAQAGAASVLRPLTSNAGDMNDRERVSWDESIKPEDHMSNLTEPRIARLAEQADVNFGPLSFYRRLVGGDEVPVFTGIQTCESGYMTRMHWHPYIELLFVIEGEATIYLEGREDAAEKLGAGDMVALPPNIPHVFGNAGQKTLRILGIHTAPERVVNFTDGTMTQAHGFVDYGDNAAAPASVVAPAPRADVAAGARVWRGLDAEELRRQFDMRIAVPDGESFTQARAARSAPLRASLPGERDVRYGSGPRQLVDIYSGTADGPIVMFFHGGAWRYQSKEAFAFVAEPLVSAGITTVVVGYDLIPQVTLPDIMREACEALAWSVRTLAPAGNRRIVLAGHSAGAQLAGMALAHDFSRDGLARSPVHAALLVSGSYDMEPHRHHSRYLDMGLDEAMVQRASPLRNPPLDPALELVIAAGGGETPGYIRQAVEYRDMCEARGHRARVLLAPGDHHFSVIGRLGESDHPLTLALVALAKGDE